MRKQLIPGLTRLTFPCSVFLLLMCHSLSAQLNPGAFMITAGGATSFTGIDHVLSSNSIPFSGNVFSYPALAINADYLLKRGVSLGACFSWQEMGYRYPSVSYDYQNAQGSKTGSSAYLTWTDTYHRYNTSIRALYHYVNYEKFDMYTGFRAGYTWWSRSTTNPDPYYDYYLNDKFLSLHRIPLSLQAVWGFKWYFSDELGANLEVGLGAPYMFQLGVAYKLNAPEW
jgi:hypothetical protein